MTLAQYLGDIVQRDLTNRKRQHLTGRSETRACPRLGNQAYKNPGGRLRPVTPNHRKLGQRGKKEIAQDFRYDRKGRLGHSHQSETTVFTMLPKQEHCQTSLGKEPWAGLSGGIVHSDKNSEHWAELAKHRASGSSLATPFCVTPCAPREEEPGDSILRHSVRTEGGRQVRPDCVGTASGKRPSSRLRAAACCRAGTQGRQHGQPHRNGTEHRETLGARCQRNRGRRGKGPTPRNTRC